MSLTLRPYATAIIFALSATVEGANGFRPTLGNDNRFSLYDPDTLREDIHEEALIQELPPGMYVCFVGIASTGLVMCYTFEVYEESASYVDVGEPWLDALASCGDSGCTVRPVRIQEVQEIPGGLACRPVQEPVTII